jgi:hypothetical protein
VKVAIALIICVVLATVLNLAWLFGAALPHRPAGIQPSPLPKNATIEQRDRYETALESAAIRDQERKYAGTTAIDIEILFILVAGAIALAIHLHHERDDSPHREA